jgi:hypothetical protein
MRPVTPQIPFLALAAVIFIGCGGSTTRQDKIDWRSPVFLDSGRIGMIQVEWTEIREPCCWFDYVVTEENTRMRFVSFDPDSDDLDTLFEWIAGSQQNNWPWSKARYQYPWIVYEHLGALGIYNMITGVHRSSPTFSSFSTAHFSRSGNYLVRERKLLRLESGETTESNLPANLFFNYYDDISNRALLIRRGVSPASMISHDLVSGFTDSSRIMHGDRDGVFPAAGGSILYRSKLLGGGLARLSTATSHDFDVMNPVFDTLVIPTRVWALLSRGDLDLKGRRVVSQNTGAWWLEEGVTLSSLDGEERTLFARDHAGSPRIGGQ